MYPVGLNMFSSPCVGADCYGLNARRYGTLRETTVNKVLELATERGVVMLEGPTLSGKTSLVQLLGRKADKSKQFSRVISFSPVNGRSFQHELSRFWETTWKELGSSTSEGDNDNWLLLLDGIHHLYSQENADFWRGIIDLQQSAPLGQLRNRRLRIILAGRYGTRPSNLAGDSVKATSRCLPEDWDQSCTISLDPRHGVDVGIRLTFSDYQEVLSSFRMLKWKDAVSSDGLSKVIYDVTAGQAGLVDAVLDEIDRKLKEDSLDFAPGVFDKMLRHHVASGRLLLAMQRRRGFLDNSPYNDKVLSVLDKLLDVECKAEGVCATDDGEVYTLARSMYHRAYLVQRVVDGVDYGGCISPLHRLCFMRKYCRFRPRIKDCSEDLGLFLHHTITQMSASRLIKSLKHNTVGAPYNWQLQMEFLKAAMPHLPYGAHVFPYVGAEHDASGHVDLWVSLKSGTPSKWAIMLLTDGKWAHEHAQQFAEGQICHELPCTARALVDLRGPSASVLSKEPTNFQHVRFASDCSTAKLIAPDLTSSELTLQA